MHNKVMLKLINWYHVSFSFQWPVLWRYLDIKLLGLETISGKMHYCTGSQCYGSCQ